jgi:hypothetical protein
VEIKNKKLLPILKIFRKQKNSDTCTVGIGFKADADPDPAQQDPNPDPEFWRPNHVKYYSRKKSNFLF